VSPTRRAVIAGGVWAVPTILTAEPASGATTLSGPLNLNGPSEIPTAPPAQTPQSESLAFTGANIELTGILGAGFVAGGWALHQWSARKAEQRGLNQ
jgi:hypothetical protein